MSSTTRKEHADIRAILRRGPAHRTPGSWSDLMWRLLDDAETLAAIEDACSQPVYASMDCDVDAERFPPRRYEVLAEPPLEEPPE